jgi:RNA polymerase sigma-70 factor (ECF subfamily)
MEHGEIRLSDVDNKEKESYQRFIKLYLANERRIYGYVRALIANWSDVDDIIQETASVMWSKFDGFQEGTNFSAWALRIAHFQVLNYCKNHKKDKIYFSNRAVDILSDQIMARDQNPDQRLNILKNCLEKLQAGERDLIQMRYEHGATTRGVSEKTGKALHVLYRLLDKIHIKLLLCVRRTLSEEMAS